MCEARDPVTQIMCLRADDHQGEHIALGRDGWAAWTVTWHDPATIRRSMAEARGIFDVTATV